MNKAINLQSRPNIIVITYYQYNLSIGIFSYIGLFNRNFSKKLVRITVVKYYPKMKEDYSVELSSKI